MRGKICFFLKFPHWLTAMKICEKNVKSRMKIFTWFFAVCNFCVTSAMRWNHMKVSIGIDDERWWLDHAAIKTASLIFVLNTKMYLIKNYWKQLMTKILLPQINPKTDKCDYLIIIIIPHRNFLSLCHYAAEFLFLFIIQFIIILFEDMMTGFEWK